MKIINLIYCYLFGHKLHVPGDWERGWYSSSANTFVHFRKSIILIDDMRDKDKWQHDAQ